MNTVRRRMRVSPFLRGGCFQSRCLWLWREFSFVPTFSLWQFHAPPETYSSLSVPSLTGFFSLPPPRETLTRLVLKPRRLSPNGRTGFLFPRPSFALKYQRG